MKKIISRVISILHSLEIGEYEKISESDHIEQITSFFNIFHKYIKNYELLTDINDENLIKNFHYLNKIESYKDEKILLGNYINLNLEDNKDFTISKSLNQTNKKDFKSIYELIPDLKTKIMKKIGFGFEFDNKNVILRTYRNNLLKKGTFLGFFGGNVKKEKNDTFLNENEWFKVIKRPQGLIFNSENKLEYPNPWLKFSKKNINKNYIKLEDINFYSIFHKIKHANVEEEPNVILLDINIPTKYFPNYFFKYLPYNYEFKLKDKISMWGAFATKTLYNKDKLYLDYWDSHILTFDDLNKNKIPKWLCYHQNINPFFVKKGYENEVPNFLKKYKKELIPEKILDKEDLYKFIDEDIIKIKKYEDQLENKEKFNKLLDK